LFQKGDSHLPPLPPIDIYIFYHQLTFKTTKNFVSLPHTSISNLILAHQSTH